jgi:hypothetical protein
MLQLFETLISGRGDTARLTWLRHSFMYTIAIHHLHHYLFATTDAASSTTIAGSSSNSSSNDNTSSGSSSDMAILEPRWARLVKLMKSNPVYTLTHR